MTIEEMLSELEKEKEFIGTLIAKKQFLFIQFVQQGQRFTHIDARIKQYFLFLANELWKLDAQKILKNKLKNTLVASEVEEIFLQAKNFEISSEVIKKNCFFLSFSL